MFDILTRWHNKRDNGGNNPTRHTTNCSPDATHHQSQLSPQQKGIGDIPSVRPNAPLGIRPHAILTTRTNDICRFRPNFIKILQERASGGVNMFWDGNTCRRTCKSRRPCCCVFLVFGMGILAGRGIGWGIIPMDLWLLFWRFFRYRGRDVLLNVHYRCWRRVGQCLSLYEEY